MQLAPDGGGLKEGPIVYGHHHLNTTNTEAARKFWIGALGGVLVTIGTNNAFAQYSSARYGETSP